MRLTIPIAAALICGACTSHPPTEGSTMNDGSTMFTLHCDDGWAGCYSAAAKACGNSGYTEIDRVADGSLTSAGHVQNRVFTGHGRENEIYDEGVREDVTSRVLTIRCK